jgi:hypothetical protein
MQKISFVPLNDFVCFNLKPTISAYKLQFDKVSWLNFLTLSVYQSTMPLFSESDITPQSTAVTTSTASVTTTAAVLIASNPNRKGLTIKNTGNKTMYIGFTSSVSSNNAFMAITNGATYEFPLLYTGDIYAIGGAATTALITEFV